jgi:hypothetical protein
MYFGRSDMWGELAAGTPFLPRVVVGVLLWDPLHLVAPIFNVYTHWTTFNPEVLDRYGAEYRLEIADRLFLSHPAANLPHLMITYNP